MSRLPSLRPSARRHGVGIAFADDHLVLGTSDGRLARSPLPAGFLTPSPTEPNCASTAGLARTIRDGLAGLDLDPRRRRDGVIALPDRAVHVGFVASAAALRRLRAELIGGIFPKGAATGPDLVRFGSLTTGPWNRRSTLGAVSGASVVSQYEAAAEAAGVRPRWADATSLAVLPEWLAGATGRRALLLLHRRHFALAEATDGALTGFRLKLRAECDPDPPLLALQRLDRPGELRLAVWGDGARALGGAVHPPAEVHEGGEVSPLTAWALAALLRRAGLRAAPPRREAA